MKKIIILITFLLFITGCHKYNDLNDLAIIKSIGISYQDKYILYAEIIEEIDKNNIPKTKVIETNSNNIQELFNNIKILINKEIYFSHIDLLLLDFELNDSNYQELINYFLKHNEFRNDFLCIFSNDIKSVLENAKYDEIEELITTNKETKDVIKISFEELMKNFLDKKAFTLSKVNYNNEIIFEGNYQYKNNKIERIKDEKD